MKMQFKLKKGFQLLLMEQLNFKKEDYNMVNWLGRLDKSCFEEDSILIFPDTFYKFEKTDY